MRPRPKFSISPYPSLNIFRNFTWMVTCQKALQLPNYWELPSTVGCLNSSGLLLYYTANIRSLLTYACPVWGTIISDHHQQRITQIERRALKIVNPDISYNEAIGNHNLQPVVSFIDDISRRLMSKIDNNPGHPLRELITYKTGRQTRVSLSTNMPVCRTAKLMRSFFYKYGKFQSFILIKPCKFLFLHFIRTIFSSGIFSGASFHNDFRRK